MDETPKAGQIGALHDADWESIRPLVSDHELIRCIGRGSYGSVWLCRNVMGSYRSAKVVYERRFKDERPFQREFEGIQEYEAVSLTHPGLVAVLQVGIRRDDGYFYYLMELADDVRNGQAIDPDTYSPRTLQSVKTEHRRLPLEEVVQVGLTLCGALSHLHGQKLLHRDVKPSNVIFVRGAPKLADIGLLTQMNEAETVVGTLGYMAPEGTRSPSADLYSLGKVLYEISTGKDRQEFPELPADLIESTDSVRFLRLNRILIKACANDPRLRYQSGQEMKEELLALGVKECESRATVAGRPSKAPRAVIIYKSGLEADDHVLQLLEKRLPAHGVDVVVDRRVSLGIDWVRKLEQEIRDADVVIAILSADSIQSEMLAYNLELGSDAAHNQDGRPRLLPIRVRWDESPPDHLAKILGALPALTWQTPADDEKLINELVAALGSPREPAVERQKLVLESVGGAVPLDSRFYVERPTDREFQEALERRDSIVLVKGARQMGKTSLLARGLHHARQSGIRVVLTDFQKLDETHLASADLLFRRLADFLMDQLDLKVMPEDVWDARRSPNTNFERYLRREVLGKIEGHLVWGLDEIDRLFACTFGGGVFGLFRSWHNERALDSSGPWSRLTLAIAYATEAHLFITDVNQSPFNVGTRLGLDDFNPEQVDDLIERHGMPLRTQSERASFFNLLGGQPYLVRLALRELAAGKISFSELSARADQDEGIFGDHLRRILVLLAKDPALCEIMRNILRHRPSPDAASFYRLRSAGIIKGDGPEQATPRCEIYARYLKRHLL